MILFPYAHTCTHVSPEDVVGVGSDVSGQAKVTDLGNSTLSQQDVSGCQVSVDALHTHTHTMRMH